MWFNIVYGIAFAVLAIYLCIITILTIAYIRSKRKPKPTPNFFPSASIIIPFRNEEENIENLIKDLSEQIYPADWEVILVNDHSNDDSLTLAQDTIKKTKINFSIISLPDGNFGKKQALMEGAKYARYDWLVFSDADTRRQVKWLETLLSYREEKTVAITGEVHVIGRKFWQQMLAAEACSFTILTAGSIAIGRPTLANGANWAVHKFVFKELGGHNDSIHIPSGDDDLLIQKISHNYPKRISFASDDNCTIFTNSPKTIKEAINQRLRWGSKFQNYQEPLAKWLPILGVLTSVFQILLIPTTLISHQNSTGILALWIIKFTAEYILYLSASRKYLSAFLATSILYPLYVIYILIKSTLYRSQFYCKDRTYKA